LSLIQLNVINKNFILFFVDRNMFFNDRFATDKHWCLYTVNGNK
jgi:hypothetical protein